MPNQRLHPNLKILLQGPRTQGLCGAHSNLIFSKPTFVMEVHARRLVGCWGSCGLSTHSTRETWVGEQGPGSRPGPLFMFHCGSRKCEEGSACSRSLVVSLQAPWLKAQATGIDSGQHFLTIAPSRSSSGSPGFPVPGMSPSAKDQDECLRS